MTRQAWLMAAGVLGLLGLLAVGIGLFSHGYRESGTLATALALTGLVCLPLWNWKL